MKLVRQAYTYYANKIIISQASGQCGALRHLYIHKNSNVCYVYIKPAWRKSQFLKNLSASCVLRNDIDAMLETTLFQFERWGMERKS
jgi:hypothetical protein